MTCAVLSTLAAWLGPGIIRARLPHPLVCPQRTPLCLLAALRQSRSSRPLTAVNAVPHGLSRGKSARNTTTSLGRPDTGARLPQIERIGSNTARGRGAQAPPRRGAAGQRGRMAGGHGSAGTGAREISFSLLSDLYSLLAATLLQFSAASPATPPDAAAL